MSQNAHDKIDLYLKGLITVLLGITSVFLMKIVNKVDTTYESVIRLEVQMSQVERDIEMIKRK